MAKRPGIVPKTKTNIMLAPCQKPPEIKTNVWTDKVRPHGKKKVNDPNKNGENLTLKSFSLIILWVNTLGKLIWTFWKYFTPNICKLKKIIKREIIITSKALKSDEIIIFSPIKPIKPPKKENEKSLPRLKNK